MPSTTCGWCGRFANMTAASKPEAVHGREDPSETLVMCAYRCDYCNGVNVAVRSGEMDVASLVAWLDDRDDELSWRPREPRGKTYSDVPDHIAGAADEAHRCESIDAHRASVQLARSVIEATAKEKGVTEGSLYDKIERLYEMQLIREHVRDAAHEVRHFGNNAGHGDFVEPVDPIHAGGIVALMDEVLGDVFESPARVERIKQARMAKEKGGDVEAAT